MAPSAQSIRAERPEVPARKRLDAHAAPSTLFEVEREPDGALRRALTVFLVGAECPFTCVFCDLWQHTLEGPTPPGALPRQLEAVLSELRPDASDHARIKLYNASNFFDPRAVPTSDLERIAELVHPWERVLVECHARLVDGRCLDFAARLGGRLEVAIGLEVADDALLDRLGKQMTLADFDRAASLLRAAAIPFRAFVLVGAPYARHMPCGEDGRASSWPVRTVRYAFDRGAERVTLIPTRGGNGAMERLADERLWRAPSLADLEDALDGACDLAGHRAGHGEAGAVAVDLWDLERLASCGACFEARRSRLERINASGRREPRVPCRACSV